MSDDSYKDCPNFLKFGPLEQRVCQMEKRTVEDRHYSEETRQMVDGVKTTLTRWGGGIAAIIILLRILPLIEGAIKGP